MAPIDDLQSLPLSDLFAGPLLAAIDASVQAQTESADLLLAAGYEDGELRTVTFGYETSELDPETGDQRRVAREIEVPLLLFLSVPTLQVSRIEESFSAKLTQTEQASRSSTPDRVPSPRRLAVKPASKSTAYDRRSAAAFDLDVHMVAELQNESTGAELVERVANTATVERVDEERTAKLAERDGDRSRADGGRDEPGQGQRDEPDEERSVDDREEASQDASER